MACTQRCSISLRLRRNGEQPLGRLVHQRRRAARVGHDDRIGDRVDDQVQAIALGARLHFGDAQLAVVLFDLLAGAPQVGDVAQNRDDAAALPRIFGDGAQELEQQVRAVHRVDEQQLAPRRAGFLDRLARQRRRQQHVVHAHGAAAPFALFFRRGEQRQRARVRDEQPALGVGEQNRVGDGVDDVVEQRPLAPLLAIAVRQRLLAEDLIELLAEHRDEPVQLGANAALPPTSSSPKASSGSPDTPSGSDVKRGVLERRAGPALAIGGRVRRGKEAAPCGWRAR